MTPTDTDLSITPEVARRFLLAYQGLLPARSLHGEAGALAWLDRVRTVQFDPLDVVGRNPSLVLQSRVSDFTPRMLDRILYERRALVEGWDKLASMYRIEDWPGLRRQRKADGDWYLGRLKETGDAVAKVLERIGAEGPLSSHDMHHRDKVDWPWGPARLGRAALEALCFSGELVIHHRERALKHYDLASRRIPRRILDAPDPHRSERDYMAWRVLRRIRGVGLLWQNASEAWLGMHGLKSAPRGSLLAHLRERGEILAVEVEGIDPPLYMAAADRPLLERLQSRRGRGAEPRAALLAPLDNLLWDRGLVRKLFAFDYVWEVYKPEPERRWGYYVLPVIYGDRFVARLEPARHPRTGSAFVKRWWWEPGVEVTAPMRLALRRCLEAFAVYLGQDEASLQGRVVDRALDGVRPAGGRARAARKASRPSRRAR